jgi:hypothetical protein
VTLIATAPSFDIVMINLGIYVRVEEIEAINTDNNVESVIMNM